MGAVIPNIDDVLKAVMQDITDLEDRMRKNIGRIVLEVDASLKARTPVNTGSAVRNYIWTKDVPFAGVMEAIDNGDPGPTNSMPLGQEPRRDINETAAFESLLALDFTNPFQKFICTNNDPDIQGLELGLLPPAPLKSRSPNGMFAVTEALIAAKVAVRGITS